MKRFFFVVLFLMVSVSLFAESAKSIEGVIEVAGKGELPSGYFGKTAGYLPGDSVSITNPNTGMTLQILNLGTLDESSGIAILVSEETAKSLGIERNSGVKVRLAKRSGFFDENVSGDAVLDKNTLPEKEADADYEKEASTVHVAGVPLIEDEDEEEEEEEDAVDAFLASEIGEDDSDLYPGTEEDIEDEYFTEEEPEDFIEEEEEEVEEEPVIVEYPEDGTYLDDREDIEQPSPADESEVEDEEEEEVYEEPIIIDYPEPLEDEEEYDDDEGLEEEEVNFDEEKYDDDEELEEEEGVEDYDDFDEDDIDEEEFEAEDLPPVEEESEIEEDEDDEYAPIILVPTEPETPPETEEVEEEFEEETPVSEPEPIEKESDTEVIPTDLASCLLDSEDLLEKNCYYVQFATFNSVENVESSLAKFTKYPVVVVKTGNSYKMLVGPLSVDEYGAVLARLKDAGFKDAFTIKK